MNNLENVSWMTAVQDCIVEYLAPLESVEFRQQDIVNNFEDRLQDLFPNNHSIPATVSSTLSQIKDENQIENPQHGRYKLIEGKCLFLRVKLKKYEQKLQKIAEIIEL